jgi:adenylate cyclase
MMVNHQEHPRTTDPAGREPAPARTGFAARLRSGGIEPDDSEDLRLNKSLLLFATGLVCTVMMVWVAIYYLLGANLSRDLALAVQLLLIGNVLLYIRTRRFESFRTTQLGLFLFLPFVAQWAAGNLIDSSGIILWGLLGPIGAIMCIGARESIGWFIAWFALTVISGGVDYYLGDPLLAQKAAVSVRMALVFFTLNILGVATISYVLLHYFIEQKRQIEKRLEESREQVRIAQDAADHLFITPFV